MGWLLLLLLGFLGAAAMGGAGKQQLRLAPPRKNGRNDIELVRGASGWESASGRERALEVAEQAREKAEAQRRQEEEDLRNRVAVLIEFFREFPQYDEEEWVCDCAYRERDQLLRERGKIMDAHLQFVSDLRFVKRLQQVSPTTYRRATYRTRALSIAERFVMTLPQAPAPVRKRRESAVKAQARTFKEEAEVAYESLAAKLKVLQRINKQAQALGLDEDDVENIRKQVMEGNGR